MAKETKAQKNTVERVMHEFHHGELKSGPDGKAGTVKNPKQAVAIALSEAGASNRKTPKENAKARRTTRSKEAKCDTAQQQAEDGASPTHTRAELYAQAKTRDIPGRSKMNKAQLEKALKS